MAISLGILTIFSDKPILRYTEIDMDFLYLFVGHAIALGLFAVSLVDLGDTFLCNPFFLLLKLPQIKQDRIGVAVWHFRFFFFLFGTGETRGSTPYS